MLTHTNRMFELKRKLSPLKRGSLTIDKNSKYVQNKR